MISRKILNEKFLNSDAVSVSKKLLGKLIVRQTKGKKIKALISEVEAYHGFKDKASHAHRGVTDRNKIMFGDAGFWYVYLCYGVHYMLNIVTHKGGYPSAILIRGIILENGQKINGPGKVTKIFKIDKRLNGQIAGIKSGLWLESITTKEKKSFFKNGKIPRVKKGSRIGVDYAGPVWSKKQYRFWFE